MPDSSLPPYHVDRLPRVNDQALLLARRARRHGIHGAYEASWRFILDRLESDPTSWGDPEYHTVHEGGTVYHAVRQPLYVRYVVYEPDRVVCILEVMPLSGPLLADDD